MENKSNSMILLSKSNSFEDNNLKKLYESDLTSLLHVKSNKILRQEKVKDKKQSKKGK